ncbi:glycosyltransferase family 2 protein [Auriculariales sp. MPI-PUGE-AT-0066]|nr:glycosyltransferase family 2 protein [Auriculariales sp. MPI-PUGE-AT-0066]
MPVQVKEVQNTVEEVPLSSARRAYEADGPLRWWVRFTWLCAWWIPSFTLKHIGRMKRPDIQMAWREKVAICMIIYSFCGIVLFFIIFFGRVLCPNFDKGYFSVAVQGERPPEQPALPVNAAQMKELVGQDLTPYFPIPLSVSCPGLVTDVSVSLESANFTAAVPNAIHISGVDTGTASNLSDINWYKNRFLPSIKNYKKGLLLWPCSFSLSSRRSVDIGKKWAIFEGGIYDLSDYFYTVDRHTGDKRYAFLDSRIIDLTGVVDCILIVAAAIIMSTILVKFLAALQLGGKRNPELQDKFESLRRTIDSLAALKYDDKRKLIFLICDGNIIGSDNDRPTPRIVLDILGADPKLDPEPLLLRSIGEGSKQINFGTIYSGLYMFEGHVVPYVVIVKVGKPSERSRPGNRDKRDSQILLMHCLNRVHFDAPMSPLELEIYHQMRNVIGIDPAFYEYIFMVDADTLVTPDSLNRLVAVTSDDAQVIAVCGETRLYNEEIHVRLHHLLARLLRIRTADKGRPLIISNRVIDDYSECIVDTLQKKNLLSLGEDRYLTTIMMKHFPTFKMNILLSQRRRWINSTIHNLVELVFLPELFGFCCFFMRFIVFVDLLGALILPATAVYVRNSSFDVGLGH